MRSKPTLLIWVVLTNATIALAQGGGDYSPSRVSALIQAAKAGDPTKILEMGSLGDRSAVPYLQEVVHSRHRYFGSPAANAQMALAKLGEQKQWGEILRELHSDEPTEQDHAVEKLSYIGGGGGGGARRKGLGRS